MAVSAGYVEHVIELLAGLGPLRIRRMFGGAGVYRDDRMFALIADEVLYLKADAESRGAFEAARSQPFTAVMRGRTETMNYWRLPADASDDPAAAERWALLGLEAALRAKAPKKKKGRVSPAEDLGPGPWAEG